jgi:hypothetical protein
LRRVGRSERLFPWPVQAAVSPRMRPNSKTKSSQDAWRLTLASAAMVVELGVEGIVL